MSEIFFESLSQSQWLIISRILSRVPLSDSDELEAAIEFHALIQQFCEECGSHEEDDSDGCHPCACGVKSHSQCLHDGCDADAQQKFKDDDFFAEMDELEFKSNDPSGLKLNIWE